MNDYNEIKVDKELNIYGKFISGTQKLWKNEKSNLIETYISDKKEIGRKFLKNDSVSYYEIYEDKRLNILGHSKKISLLFYPNEDINHPFDIKNNFGFRYYEKDNREKCNYFTLIKKKKKGYYILEKNNSIKDVDNESFYNKDLDCFSIIKNIVYDKYKEDKVYKKSPHGELFSEIIGFIYSMVYLGKFKNFIILEPFIPNRLEKESLSEGIPDVLEDNIGYIEPILYDYHVSVLLVVKDKYCYRKNYLLDMSKHHSEKNIYDHTLFPLIMINNLSVYPDKSIQKNNSCGLWFYGILDLIYSSDDYNKPQDILNKIEFNRSDFYIDVVNFLSEKLYKLKNMIIFKDMDEGEIDIKRVYDIINGEGISFLKECITNYYFSLSLKYDWIDTNKVDADGINLLFCYEMLFGKIFDYKREIEMNNDYYKEYSELAYYKNNIQPQMEFKLKKISELLKKVDINFRKEFRNNIIDNINEYMFILEDKNALNSEDLEKKYKSLIKMKTENVHKLKKEFSKIKKDFEHFKLLDESTIVNNLNPNGEILFKLMNK